MASTTQDAGSAGLDVFVRRLPKVELHCHLPGAIPVEAYLDISRANGIPVRSAVGGDPYAFTGFEDFLELYGTICSVLRTRADFERAIYAALERQSKTGNVRYTELFFSPSDHPTVPYATQVDGLVDGIRAAERDLGVVARLIPSINRTLPAAAAVEMVEQVVAHRRDEVLGIGMDNNEALGPPAKFVEAFQLAGRNGLKRTAHAGERGSAEEVAVTIDALGVDRIDHGYGIMRDAELVKRAVDRGLPFTGCWTVSLIQMGRPVLGHMIEAGLRVSINSDDPAVIPTDLSKEYREAAAAEGLDRQTVIQCVMNAAEATWLDDSDRRALRGRLESEIHALQAELADE
ncbi:adenosine deaminase [Streptomyces hokutonensis]|uniref:adenosine deaminase n=1 Tax=Streptomyces hokutonensis TaxID=1306990 RepID=UPI0038301FD2